MFLEVEFLSKIKVDAKLVQTQIVELVKELGLKDYEENRIPYDTQIYLKSLAD